jgi:ribosomal protein S6--L-glutamate ligase
MTRDVNIGVIAERRYLAQSQPRGLVDALERRGARLTRFDPDERALTMGDASWIDGVDLLVGRGRSWSLLTLLAWAESAGVPTINRKDAIAAVHNKAEMSVRLAAAGVPMPETRFGPIDALRASLPSDLFPVILKPIFGDNCRGLEIVASPDDLASLAWDEPVALAQPFFETDGYDVKLYGIGRDVWAVRKPSPLERPGRASASGAELLPATKELELLGRTCAEIFGLELFGIDCIVTDRGPLVIEVNDYPNFTAVPDADDRLAEYVVARARAERAS